MFMIRNTNNAQKYGSNFRADMERFWRMGQEFLFFINGSSILTC